MRSESGRLEREVLLAELRQVFDARTAEVLLSVMEKVIEGADERRVTREDFRALTGVVAELAGAQHRTDERVGSLESAVERLAEAQRETTVAVAKLSTAVDRLQKQVGGLSETVGGDIEDIAYIVLHDVLKREFGWQVGVLERSWQRWNREPEEVNLFGQARDPARPEEVIWIVGEAKHNLTMQKVKRFIRQVDRARRHLVGQVFPVCFCYRARPEVQELIREAGIRLVFSYGKKDP